MGTALRPLRAPARRAARPWAWAPALTLAVFLLPVVTGSVGTLLPALGHLSALGADGWSLAPWRMLWDQPGVAVSVRLSLQIGLFATALSLAIATSWTAWARERGPTRWLRGLVSPMIATPHVAVAIGLAFMIAPSGWLVRLVSPGLTGWDRPPTGLVTVRDPLGAAMVLALVLKEVPYLLLMLAAALKQVPHRALLRSGVALGYRPAVAWFKLVYPQLHGMLRLPVYAVLAFSMSSVDVGLILAPGNPPPLAVLAARWFGDYDLQRYFPAAAAALTQGGLVLAALAAWRLGEGLVARAGRRWCERGQRAGPALAVSGAAAALGGLCLLLGTLSWAAMALWSLARTWRYPQLLPQGWTLDTWVEQGPRLGATLANTVSLALTTAALALALTIACLESEVRRGRAPTPRASWWLYVPLLVPQIAFLYGFQVLLVRLGWDGRWAAVAWAHGVFVLPYVYLSLADPWRALDPRYARTASALGATPWRVLWRVRLPLLLRPIGVACATGCAVSVGLYLPTVFAGAGRVATLTTEAVTLSSGADRRVMGVYTFLQAALPLAAYGLAWAVPAWRDRHRRGLA